MDKTPKILVTGATSGLGREIALQLATSGEQVLACGRRAERLAELEATAGITGKTLDLSDSDAVRSFCAATGPLSGVILNAGITFADRFDAGSAEQDAALLQTNVSANLLLIRELLPTLKQSQGKILIVASLGGLTPLPYQAVYAGTKAFMVNFGLSLREELKANGVSVSVFAPGGIKTEMTDIPEMVHLEKDLAPVSDVAQAALKSYTTMPALCVPGVQNKIITLAARLMPRSFMAKQGAKIYRKDP